MSETKPPALPGEVWRGEVDGLGLCAVHMAAKSQTESYPRPQVWGDANGWISAGSRAWSLIFAAWALAERRRADEMRERCAAYVEGLRDVYEAPEIAAAIRKL
jgi:hypothetical protein